MIAITPNGSATFPSRVQSRRDDLKVAQDVSPGNTPWQFGQSRRDG